MNLLPLALQSDASAAGTALGDFARFFAVNPDGDGAVFARDDALMPLVDG